MFTDGMRLDPDNTKCRLALKLAKDAERFKEEGNDAIKIHNYDLAIELYTKSLTVDEYNKKLLAIVYSNRSTAYSKKGDLNSALKDCNKSIELDPTYWKGLLKRADIYMKKGEFDLAIGDYNKIKEIDPHQNMSSYIKEA